MCARRQRNWSGIGGSGEVEGMWKGMTGVWSEDRCEGKICGLPLST